MSLKEDGDMSILETSFHDTLADSRRIPPHRDYHNLEIAALGERVKSFLPTLKLISPFCITDLRSSLGSNSLSSTTV